MIDTKTANKNSSVEAVRSVIKVFISKDEDYYKPLSQSETVARIDEAIAQVDAGLSFDAEETEKEIMSEFGL